MFLATRAKGRLQHALRLAGSPQEFSRKLAVRSIGDNHTADVEAYIASQVSKARFADARYAQALQGFTFVDPNVDLAQPAESARGRYWYNLHLVFVVQQRGELDRPTLQRIYDTCGRIAAHKGYSIKSLSLMPDHLHLALRGDIERSPQEIALAFQNNTAYALGQRAIWCENFYAGTFSEYDMGAVRRDRSVS